MSIEENIAVRKAASEALEMMSQYGAEQGFSGDAVKAYWDECQSVLNVIRGVKEEEFRAPPDAMTREEALKFEQRVLPQRFTKYAGERICDVDISYFVWIDNNGEFNRAINRYLKSPIGQERQRNGR